MPKLSIDLELRLAQFQDTLNQVNRSATKTANDIGRSFSGITSAFTTLRTLATGGVIGGFFAAAGRAALEAEEANKRLAATLRATGNSAGFTKERIDQMAESLADITAFDDDSIRNAAAEIAKFGSITGEAFERALKAAADWAAFSGQEIPEAARAIGVAISGTDAGLGRLERQLGGLTYAEETFIKSLQESGDILGAQNEKLRIIEQRVGGLAEALNTGFLGATREVRKQWGELLEGFGQTATEAGTVERTLRGLAALLRDIRLESQGTRTPLSNLADDILGVNLSVLKVLPGLGLMVSLLEKTGRIPRFSGGSQVAQGKITGLGADEAEQRANERRLQAFWDAELKRGDEAMKRLEKEAEEARKKAIASMEAASREFARLQRANLREFFPISEWEDDWLGFQRWLNQNQISLERAFDLESQKIEEKLGEIGRRAGVRIQEELEKGMTGETAIAIQREMMQKEVEELERQAKQTADVMRDLGVTFTSAFEDAIVEGRELSEVLKGIERDLIRLLARKTVTEPLLKGVTGLLEDVTGGKGIWDVIKGIFSANGNVLRGGFEPFAFGGIVKRPTLGLVGEGGMNEAVVPLPDGRAIPVDMRGGSGGVTVNVINAPAGTRVEERQGDEGLTIDVIIDQQERTLADRLGRGQGSLASMLERTYGLSRAPGMVR